MAEYLEPIVQSLILDAERFLSGMKDVRTAMLQANAAAKKLQENIVQLDDVLDDMSISAGAAARATNDLRDAVGETAIADSRLTGAMNDLRDAIAQDVLATKALTGALDGLIARQVAAAGTADKGRTSFRLWGTGIRATGNAVHWFIGVFAELAAVVIPATFAAGAWAAVWLQGTTNVIEHMKSVYTATEAMANAGSKTAGQVVGLGDALQKAQDAANPDVYQALGGAINIVNEHFGNLAHTGLQVGKIFDTFMGKLAFDFSSAGKAGQTMDKILANMVPDLTGIGQFFGNLGGTVANFAAQMPGLAEVLLKFLDTLAKGAEALTQFAGSIRIGRFSILTLVMAFEELNRWGGLGVSMLGKVGLASETLAKGMLSPTRAMGVLKNAVLALPMAGAKATQGLGKLTQFLGSVLGAASAQLAGKLGKAGSAIEDFGSKAEKLMSKMPAWQGALIAVAAIGLAFLIDKLVTAQTAAEKFTSSMQKNVENLKSNFQVIPTINENINQLSQRMITAHTSALKLAQANSSITHGVPDATRAISSQTLALDKQHTAYVTAQQSLQTYGDGITRQVKDQATMTAGAYKIAGMFGLTIPQAMGAADMAGVNLTKSITTQSGALNALGFKIANLMSGYRAMGQSSGMVGHDMLAVAIQTGDTATKVQQLNQAWDQFMQGVTGGTGSLSTFEQSIKNIGSGIAHVSQNLGQGSAGSFNASIRTFAQDLTRYTGQGAQAWQNFDQVVGSTMPQLADWFRQAGSEGAMSGKQISKAILDMEAQMVPFAKKSKTAQAELVAFAQAQNQNINTFPQLVKAIKDSGANAQDLGKKVDDATQKMANMSKIAQNLGDVMDSAFTQSMSQAALNAVNFQGKTNDLSAAIKQYGAGSHQAQTAAQNLENAWKQAGKIADNMRSKVNQLQTSIDHLHGKDISIIYRITQQGVIPQQGTGTSGHDPIAASGFQGSAIHIHVAGSVHSEQSLATAVQGALNKTALRNGRRAHLFIAGAPN